MNDRTNARAVRWPVWIVAVVVLFFGLFMAIGGARLAALGGSWYFVLAGIALIVAAVLMFRGRRLGAWIYALTMLGTLAWALWDFGLETWPLISRLFAFAVLSLLVALVHPWLARR